MCGRYVTPEQRAMEAAISHIPRSPIHDFRERERYNVAPTTVVPVVLHLDALAIVRGARWGLIPHWWNKDTLPSFMFNARSEEAASKPAWRNGLRHQRCLMPALGWYEWCESEKVKNDAGKTVNQPYFLQSVDREVIAFAGIWSTWTAPSGNEIVSCALLSKSAAPGIAEIHHRMPAVLPPERFNEWLDPATSLEDVHRIIADARQDLVAFRVSTLVNNVRNESADLILPA